jgi:FkbM family methyltransferase
MKKKDERVNYKLKIFIFFLKNISFLFPQKLFYLTEYLSSILQGKGFGAFSLGKEINACKKLLGNRSIKIIFDVGANKGKYTKELLKTYKYANYYLFEPNLLNYKKLKFNFQELKNIKIINKALSNKNGLDFLYSDKSGSSLGSLFKRRLDHFNINFDNKEKINLTRLDTFLQEENKDIIIDYFKMDVEGSELKILESSGAFINRIKLIQFEFGGCNIDSRTFFQDFWYYFKNNNFDLFRITIAGPKKIKEYSESDEFFKTTNYIALNRNL